MMHKIRDYPYLALHDQVLFPGTVCSLQTNDPVGRKAKLAACETDSKTLAIFTAKTSPADALDHLHPVGVLAVVRADLGDSIEVEVTQRVRLRDLSSLPHPIAQVELLPPSGLGPRSSDLDLRLRELAEKVFALSGERGRRAGEVMEALEADPVQLVDFLASTLALPTQQAVELLACNDLEESQERLLRAQSDMLTRPRDGMLRAFTWADQEDSQEQEGDESARQLRVQLEELDLPTEVYDRVYPELEKLERFDPALFDHQETLARLEALAAFPWHERQERRPSLKRVQKALDRRIVGHRRAKDQLLDLVATLRASQESNPGLVVLCAPPGLGQGVLVRTLAQALNRPLEQIQLSETGSDRVLAGAARSTPGARVGAVYEAALSAGCLDPVVHLRSDVPIDSGTAHQLELLSTDASRRRFRDEYLGLPLDVSRMLFVLEVRSPDMVGARLRERALVISLESYSSDEKKEIARQHLWPAALRHAGLSADAVPLDAAVLHWLVQSRTQEGGVSTLWALLRQLARRQARVGSKAESGALGLEFARDCLGDRTRFAREGAALGVVGQVLLTREGARVYDFAALPQLVEPNEQQPACWNQASALAQHLATAAGGAADLSLQAPPEVETLAQEMSLTVLSMALALRSAQLRVRVPRDLAVIGSLNVASEVGPVDEIRERAMAAWRAGYGTLLVPAVQVSSLSAQLPEEVSQELKLVGVANLQEAVEALASLASPRDRKGPAAGESERAA